MAAVALANIWDDPVVQSPRAVSSPPSDHDDRLQPSDRPAKRPRTTLFFESDSEEEATPPVARRTGQSTAYRSEIDAMFDNLDDEPIHDLPPALDLDALRREEDAKNARTLAKSSPLDLTGSSHKGARKKGEDDEDASKEKKERKQLPKLDASRLLGPDGFPALIKHAKTFKPKGKGHEADDLNRLLNVYQFWTHKLYPRMPFDDTVQRVEKICHSQRMHVALSVWKDEAKGISVNGRKLDIGSDAEDGDSDEEDEKGRASADNAQESLRELASSSRAPSQAPSSASEPPASDAYDDFDIDAIIREDEEREQAAAASAAPPTSDGAVYVSNSNNVSGDAIPDEDDMMWDELMGDLPDVNMQPQVQAPNQPIQPTSSSTPEDDEDMWDAVREIEGEGATADSGAFISPPAPHMPQEAETSKRPTNEEGWDEMYA
ncbi:Swi3-domain-containing protein [Laetiporus sulphureus 93-53]|uniref:Chromosome segregation in meiosis protein n=1 Tax=Laetiporus sulphureus 93-53 TaxID=1314785 RepID=A0A165FWC3_9APHY|nr:Swi3-domain-containing protein [Laetiporus sulphureus 93-53]KZT09497.1 Swi3-domain-containing protein [Laetiporus sulphureus 93-53]